MFTSVPIVKSQRHLHPEVRFEVIDTGLQTAATTAEAARKLAGNLAADHIILRQPFRDDHETRNAGARGTILTFTSTCPEMKYQPLVLWRTQTAPERYRGTSARRRARVKSESRRQPNSRRERPGLEVTGMTQDHVLEPRLLLSTIVVNTVNDSGSGSLRAAVADATNGDPVVFSRRLAGRTITLQSEIDITKSITIPRAGRRAR